MDTSCSTEVRSNGACWARRAPASLEVGLEPEVYELVEAMEDVLKEETALCLERGEGYSDCLNGKGSILPTCGVWNLRVPLTEQYKKWLAPRVDMYNAMGRLINSERCFYLLYAFHCEVTDDRAPYLFMQVYATQSLQEENDAFIDAYEGLSDAKPLNGYELYGGLIALADFLATLHLIGTMPVVVNGALASADGMDGLTDLWVRLYDDQEAGYAHTGLCEVCGKLFVSSNPRMQGHPDCMNRQRVTRSRARKYQAALDVGLSIPEASRMAGISPAKAEGLLGRLSPANDGEERI